MLTNEVPRFLRGCLDLLLEGVDCREADHVPTVRLVKIGQCLALASEQLAHLAFADGRHEDGMRWLARILSDHPRSDREPSARLRLAQLEFGRDRRAAARSLLEPLDLDDLNRAEQRAALRLRVALARTPVERMEQLALLRAKLLDETEASAEDPVTRGRLETRLAAVDRDIAELGGVLRSEVEAINAGAAVRRSKMIEDTAAYVKRLRDHMQWEEEDLFSRIDLMLNAEPYTVDISSIEHIKDPVFELEVEAGFRRLLDSLAA